MHPTDKDLVFTIIMISFSFLSHVWKEWLSRSGICCRVCFEVHPFGTVGRSHLQPLALRRWQAVHRPSAYNCDPNPPTYCSNRVVRLQTKSCFILFINREERGAGGARMGRVVASKCDPYYVWHTHISTIQECMQTANLRQNVNSWYLATNANKFWNQSWKMWNKKSNP